MAHASQERYSALVDAKLRATLVTRDNTIFNNRYEGSPKAGKVKIPVRDTEVAVKAYDKANGVDADAGTTTYLDLDIDNDEAVNEIIDGFDAASVPDGITAERLDSAGYSMALSIDKKSMHKITQKLERLVLMVAKLWAQEIMFAETAEEAKALYERCPRLLKEKVKAILIKSGFEEIVQ